MFLAKRIVFKPSKEELIALNSLSYSSAKFPDWYDQKKRLKDEFYFKNLPSQTAQNTLDILHKSWKSFFKLKETGGIKNPRPPRFKKNFNFSFLNNGFMIIDDNTIRFSLAKQMKE